MIQGGWQEQGTGRSGKRPRRYYELTGKGKAELGAWLAQASSSCHPGGVHSIPELGD